MMPVGPGDGGLDRAFRKVRWVTLWSLNVAGFFTGSPFFERTAHDRTTEFLAISIANC